MGRETVTPVRVSDRVREITETDMLEENPVLQALPLSLHFGPFEIKTLLLRL